MVELSVRGMRTHVQTTMRVSYTSYMLQILKIDSHAITPSPNSSGLGEFISVIECNLNVDAYM